MIRLESVVAPVLRVLAGIGRAVLSSLRQLGALTIFAANGIAACVSPPWYGHEIGRQMMRIGYYSLPVIGLTAIFIGAALALNIYVGGSRFNAESFVPNVVVLGITRELGPVFAGLMLSGRVGASIAAETGAMRITEQIDALRVLSVSPARFLVAPRIIAAVVTLPVLVLVADIIGVMGGYLVAVFALDFAGPAYIRNTLDFVTFSDVATGLLKASVFGFIIALVGCQQGSLSAGGAGGVGRAATLAVVISAVFILASNYVLTSIFTGWESS